MEQPLAQGVAWQAMADPQWVCAGRESALFRMLVTDKAAYKPLFSFGGWRGD
jgi:hypothetical protein